MKRFAAGFALAAALLGSTLAGTALGQDYNSQRDRQDYNAPRDNSPPQDQGWGRNRGNRTAFEGQWIADDRAADSRSDRRDFRGGGMGSAQLPNFIRIDQRPGVFRITDRRNRVLQQITIGGRFDPRNNGNDENLVGRLRGQTLVVERAGFRGATITQTFSLENRGRTLVVRTRRDPVGRGPTTEVSTTYRRA